MSADRLSPAQLAHALAERHTLRYRPTEAEMEEATGLLTAMRDGPPAFEREADEPAPTCAEGARISGRDFRVGRVTLNLESLETGNGVVITVTLPNGDWEDVIVRQNGDKLEILHG